MGLNANFEVAELPVELRATATTLQGAFGVRIDLDAAAARLGERLSVVLGETGVSGAQLALTRAMLFGVGQRTRVSLPTGEKVEAVLIGLDRGGNAVFEQEGSRWVAPGGSVLGN